MANIRFVKAPNDNRVRPISAVAMGDLNYNSPLTSDSNAHASVQRSDNVKARPSKEFRNTEAEDRITTRNNSNDISERIVSSSSRGTAGNSKEDDRGNNYTDSRPKLSKRQSFKESPLISAVGDNNSENRKYTRVDDTLKQVANKTKETAEKQSTSHSLHSQQASNRQNTSTTAQQFKSQSGNRTLYRSISEAEITDEPSFFSSISDVKYYGLDIEDTETEYMAASSKEKKISPEMANEFSPDTKRSDEAKTVNNYGAPNSGRRAEHENASNVEKSETKRQNKMYSPEEMKASTTLEKKPGRQDVSKPGLDNNSKSNAGGRAENERESNIEKSQTVKQNQQQLQEQKKPRLAQENNSDTLEGGRGGTLAVVKGKISEAIKTGTLNEIQNKTLGTSQGKLSQDRNFSVTQEKNGSVMQSKLSSDKISGMQSKTTEHKNVGLRPSEKAEDEKLYGTKSKTLGEKTVDTTQDKIQDTFCVTQGKTTDSKNGTQRNITEENKLSTMQSKKQEDKRADLMTTNVFDDRKRNSPGNTGNNTIDESTFVKDDSILDGTKRKLADGKKMGMTKRSTIEENMCDVLREKDVYQLADNKISMYDGDKGNALGVTQFNIKEERKIPGAQSNISTQQTPAEKIQDRQEEDKKSRKTQGEMYEDNTLEMWQNKPREETRSGIQSRTSEQKTFAMTPGKASEERKAGTTSGKTSDDKNLMAMQAKISEEKRGGVAQNRNSEEKQRDLAHNKTPEEKKYGVTNNNVAEERQTSMATGKKASGDTRVMSTQSKISEETKLSVKQTEVASQRKTDVKDVGVAKSNMLTDKKLHETKDKKEEIMAGKMFENKKLESQNKIINDKKIEMPKSSKMEEKKYNKSEEKAVKDSRDSTPDTKKYNSGDMAKSDAAEGAKLKAKKKERNRLDASKSGILNETTSKILEQRKNAAKMKLLDAENSVTGQKGNAPKDAKSDKTQQKASVPVDQDTTSTAALDSLTPDARMKSRRAALSNPAKMIMSQEQREKIEKDVEKTKTSVSKKVSKFLNVNLGLNKEEDLI